MCIEQFNLYLVFLVVAILPITIPAIASHNLARFNPGINPGIPGLSKLNPEIPGLAKRSGIAFPTAKLRQCSYAAVPPPHTHTPPVAYLRGALVPPPLAGPPWFL